MAPRGPSTTQPACICRLPAPTSLWASVSTTRLWPWRAGSLLPRGGPGDAKGTQQLLKRQGGQALFQDVRRPSHDQGVTLGMQGSRQGPGAGPDPGPGGLVGPCSARTDPQLQDFLGSHFLGEQVQLVKKMGDHLAHFRRLPTPVRATVSSTASPSSTTGPCRAQRPLCVPWYVAPA